MDGEGRGRGDYSLEIFRNIENLVSLSLERVGESSAALETLELVLLID